MPCHLIAQPIQCRAKQVAACVSSLVTARSTTGRHQKCPLEVVCLSTRHISYSKIDETITRTSHRRCVQKVNQRALHSQATKKSEKSFDEGSPHDNGEQKSGSPGALRDRDGTYKGKQPRERFVNRASFSKQDAGRQPPWNAMAGIPRDDQSRGNVTHKSRDGVQREAWRDQKTALIEKFGDKGWQPRKRLSPDTLEGIRSLHASDRETYSTEVLSQHFQISPEAIRRILKSKWRPDEAAVEDRRQRWERRGIRKWEEMSRHGVKVPSKWRALGVHNARTKERSETRRVKVVKWDKVVGDISEAESFAPRLL